MRPYPIISLFTQVTILGVISHPSVKGEGIVQGWELLVSFLEFCSPYDPAIPFPREMKRYVYVKTYRWIYTLHVYTLFIIAKTQKERKCPSTAELIKQLGYVYPFSGIALVNKKEQVPDMLTNMEKSKHGAKWKNSNTVVWNPDSTLGPHWRWARRDQRKRQTTPDW